MIDLPGLALSVRQPWAWAIIHSGKPVENRSWKRGNPGLAFRGRVCIHASQGMTRDELADAERTFLYAGLTWWPDAHALLRGGIIGTVEIVDVVTEMDSPWFYGPKGLVLRNPQPVPFIPCTGALGFFKWRPAIEGGQPAAPARWMLPKDAQPETRQERNDRQGSLL